MWRVIQAEEKKLNSRWSFKDKLGREFIAGRVSRKTVTGREPGQSVARKRKGAFGQGPRWPKAMAVNQPKALGRGGKN